MGKQHLNFMKFKKINLSLLVILLIGFAIRIWQVQFNPPHLTPDEAALGYNAYSVLHTLRDEHGQFLPLIFKSFGDYKPGLYVYAAVPTVLLFGLTEFAVRLPSVLAGTISIFLIYYIVKDQGSKLNATFAAGVAALNPWLIHFSRGAWEANLSLMLTLAGILLFLKSFKRVLVK